VEGAVQGGAPAEEKQVEKLSREQIEKLQKMLQDGGLEEETKKDIELLLSQQQPVSFLQFEESDMQAIMVNVHKTQETDPLIYQLIEGLESDRQKVEDQFFLDTIAEFRLITQVLTNCQETLSELEINLEAQLFPIFALINQFQFDEKTFLGKKILNIEVLHLSVKNKGLIKANFPILYRNLKNLARKMANETDSKVQTLQSPF